LAGLEPTCSNRARCIDIKDEALKAEVENLTDRFKTAIGYVGGLPGVGARSGAVRVAVSVAILSPHSWLTAAAVMSLPFSSLRPAPGRGARPAGPLP
jgi:hypothetical protein